MYFYRPFLLDAIRSTSTTDGTRLRSDDSDEDPYQFMYVSPDTFTRGKSVSIPNVAPKNSDHGRRMTYDDNSRPDLEDSADDLDPYVRMDTFLKKGVDLRQTARKANLMVKRKKDNRMRSIIREVSEEDYVFREDFLTEKNLDINDALKNTGTAETTPPTCTIAFRT